MEMAELPELLLICSLPELTMIDKDFIQCLHRYGRNETDTILENSQKGDLDITLWLEWFLTCLLNALNSADEILNKVMSKHRFWDKYSKDLFNKRQIKNIGKTIREFL